MNASDTKIRRPIWNLVIPAQAGIQKFDAQTGSRPSPQRRPTEKNGASSHELYDVDIDTIALQFAARPPRTARSIVSYAGVR